MDVLNTLVDWKKIPSISPTLVRSWGYGLSGLSEKQARKGLAASRDHVGYFDLGIYRKFCFQQEASHRPAITETARLNRPSTLGNARFRELHKVTQAMREEEGSGPIHKATLAGDLGYRFVSGKSAQEIIEFCERKYG